MIRPFSGPRYRQNADRVKGDQSPCCVCGTAAGQSQWYLRVGWDDRFYGPLDMIEPRLNAGMFPVGTSCLRRYPELKALAIKYIRPRG